MDCVMNVGWKQPAWYWLMMMAFPVITLDVRRILLTPAKSAGGKAQGEELTDMPIRTENFMSGNNIPIPTHEYIATAKCGCIIGLCADIPGLEKDTAQSVARFIRDGCTVQWVSRDSQTFRDAVVNFGHSCKVAVQQPELLS
jgi:hypothetical protein